MAYLCTVIVHKLHIWMLISWNPASGSFLLGGDFKSGSRWEFLVTTMFRSLLGAYGLPITSSAWRTPGWLPAHLPIDSSYNFTLGFLSLSSHCENRTYSWHYLPSCPYLKQIYSSLEISNKSEGGLVCASVYVWVGCERGFLGVFV